MPSNRLDSYADGEIGGTLFRTFIGSSVEGLPIAYAIQENLDHTTESVVWDQGFFELSVNTLEHFSASIHTFDFAILVFSPDDNITIRNEDFISVRDNVILELGISIGALGRKRTFFVSPRGISNLHFPTDLAGITPASYNPNRQDNNLNAALGPACNKIRKIMLELGPFDR